jgi:hypothetical protein
MGEELGEQGPVAGTHHIEEVFGKGKVGGT